MFDCDEAELNYIDEASDDEPESDDEGNDQAEQPISPENNQPPTTPVRPTAPVILADLCEGNLELKKDAAFFDTLGTMVANSETSKQFLPFLNNFKRNYIAARRSVKKRIQHSKGKNSEEDDVLVNETDVENDENGVDVPNLFENLFELGFFFI